mmetsp:Transcript_504/g.1455  ORF Transcript_504/g.1455 Transcript_504/m.1455 type:complete len:581 (+) Transcript_504:246-1988(+)
MRNGIVRETRNPLWLDKAQFGTKVRANHSQLRRGGNGNGKSTASRHHTGQIIGERNDGQDAPRHVHHGHRLVQLGIPHQESMSNGRFSKGKAHHVHSIVTETRQNQKGRGSHGVRGQQVDQVGPTHSFFPHVVEKGGQPNPPRQTKLVHTGGSEGAQKVATRPRVVALVETGHQVSVPVPALGVNDVVELEQRSTFLVGFTGHVIDPMQFTIVIKPHDTVHVQDLVLRFVLQIEAGADHGVGCDTDQDSVQGTKGSEPVRTIRVRCVKDGIRVHFLLGAHGGHVDFVHALDGTNVKMLRGKNVAKRRHDGRIILQRHRGSRCSILLVRPNVSSFLGFDNVVVNPVSKFVARLFARHGANDATIASDKQLGQKAPTHQQGINDQGHEPHRMDHEHPCLAGAHVRIHVGLFAKDPVRHVLQKVATGNRQTTNDQLRQFIVLNLQARHGHLQTSVDKRRMQQRRDHGRRQCHQQSIGVHGFLGIPNRGGELQTTPNAHARRDQMSGTVQIMLVKGMKLGRHGLVRGLTPKDGAQVKWHGLLVLVLESRRHCFGSFFLALSPTICGVMTCVMVDPMMSMGYLWR